MNNKKIILLLIIVIAISSLIFIFQGVTQKNIEYLLSRRLPKVLAIIITAITIALSTTIFQTISNNIILTPSIMGLDSLYLFVQTLIIYIFSSSSILVINKNINFFVNVLIMLIFSLILYNLIFSKINKDIMMLLLVGMILGTLFQSISSFMQMMIDPNEFAHLQGKMYASFNNINTNILLISSFIVVSIFIYLFKINKTLDCLALGRDMAITLGVDYEKETKKLLLLVSVLISISTALVGPITFLGILVVNLARSVMTGYEHRKLIIISSLISIVFLIVGQTILERLLNFSTPISVMINFVGGIYFIYLLLRENTK